MHTLFGKSVNNITIVVIDKCQKAYHMTVKKLDCLPGNVSERQTLHFTLHLINYSKNFVNHWVFLQNTKQR